MRRSLFLALTLALAQFGCNEKRGQADLLKTENQPVPCILGFLLAISSKGASKPPQRALSPPGRFPSSPPPRPTGGA